MSPENSYTLPMLDWCEIPAGVEGTQVRVQRGGAFDFSPKHARTTSRDDTKPSNHLNHDGFRVAWNLGGSNSVKL